MNITFTEDQEDFRDSVRGFLSAYSPETEVRRLMATEEGYDATLWRKMASDLGLQGIAIPEEFGGLGASWQDLGVVLEEMGRALVCTPFFSTVVLAATTILESGDTDAQVNLLPGIADGSTIATLALSEESLDWTEAGVQLEATASSGRYALTGSKTLVLDGSIADLVIVAARTAAGVTLFLVDGDAPGLTRTPLKTLDLTRKMSRLDFAGVGATVLGTEGQGWRTLDQVLKFAAIALASEQAGGAEAALHMAVEYAKDRVQFGQAIGGFQAIKHMLADVLIEVESAKSAAYYALWTATQRNEELAAAASLAKAFCSDAYVLAAHQNIQIHGGIGYTWEAAPHLYYKRAKAMELFLGDPPLHRERLAQCVGL